MDTKITYIYDKEIIKGVNKEINEVDPLAIFINAHHDIHSHSLATRRQRMSSRQGRAGGHSKCIFTINSQHCNLFLIISRSVLVTNF